MRTVDLEDRDDVQRTQSGQCNCCKTFTSAWLVLKSRASLEATSTAEREWLYVISCEVLAAPAAGYRPAYGIQLLWSPAAQRIAGNGGL